MTGLMRSGQNSRGISPLSRLLGRPEAQASSRQSKKRRRNRRPGSARKAFFQSLEPRVVLDAVSWIGGIGNWDVASNWLDSTTNTHVVPGSTDDVTIDTGATAATITIQSSDGIEVQSLITGTNDTLSIAGGSLQVDAGISTLSGPLDMTGGSLEANGNTASLTANAATTVSQANLFAESGGQLALPNLTSYASNDNTFQAEGTNSGTGAGSVLDVSALATLTQTTGWSVNALSGGIVKLSGLTSLTSAQGATIIDTGSSTILDGKLTTLTGVSARLDGTDAHVADAWTTFTKGSLEVDGNASGSGYSLSGLTDVDGSQLLAESGGQLALPNLTSYASNGNTFQAEGTNGGTGAGSVLDVSALATLTPTAGWGVNALSGGTVKLSGLTSLTGTQGVTINDTGSSTILDGKLAALTGVSAKFDGTDAHVADAWTTFTKGSLEVDVGAYSLPGLTDVDGSQLLAESGGQLALPNLTSYVANGNTFQAEGTNSGTGAGSVLDVSALATLTQTGSWNVNALSGGTVKLSGLTSLNATDGGTITDTGSSTIQDGKLTTLAGISAKLDGTDAHVADAWTAFTDGTLDVTGGAFTFPQLTDLSGTDVPLDGGPALDFPVLVKGALTVANGQSVTIQGTHVGVPVDGTSGPSFNVPASAGLNITFQNSGTLTGTIVNVGQGSTATFFGGTYLGGVTFNVAGGGTVDLVIPGGGPGSGGAAELFGGTLTGSGGGTVVLDGSDSRGGGIGADTGGMTLNFPAGMFQWQAGWMFGRFGNITNMGTMNLTGADDMILAEDGTLFNDGTIIQTGTGLLDLDEGDNRFPTELVNEANGSYLIESATGINSTGGGPVEVQNAGTIRKTADSGTATISVNGALDNSGTIEAGSGTLLLTPTSLVQLSGNTLTAGTWNALNGATLDFGIGNGIITNDATIGLGGSGASMPALAILNSNGGSVSLTGGASLTTNGSISNSGNLTIGAGSTLTVGGAFTQTAAGTLNVQIGGTPASGQFSQVVSNGTATLDGSLNLALVNSYTPTAGQDYPVLLGDFIGAFATISGLPAGMITSEGTNSFDLVMPSSAADLEVTSVTAPSGATGGNAIDVAWHVKDVSTLIANNASDSWLDSVYVSSTPTITPRSILLGSVLHRGALAAGAGYDGSLTAALPPLLPGYYYILIEADSHYQVADEDRSNNTRAADTGPLQLTLPAITPGTPIQGAFTAANQDHYYQVTVPAGGASVLTLTSAAADGSLALYVSQGTTPTPYNAQYAGQTNQTNQTNPAVSVVVPAGATYYVLVHSIAGTAATAGYTLNVTQVSTLTVSAISTYQGGDYGDVTIEIDGENFSRGTTATMTWANDDNITIPASAIDFASASQIFATFHLTDARSTNSVDTAHLGSYTVKVQDGSQSATAPTLFQVVKPTLTPPPPGASYLIDDVSGAIIGAPPLPLQVDLSVPEYVRSGRTGTIVITYTNPNNFDLVAPLLTIQSSNSSTLFSMPDDPNDFVTEAQVVATDPVGPAGILRPGQSGTLTLTLLSDDTIDNDPVPIQVSQIETGPTTYGTVGPGPIIDWASQKAALQPSSIPTAAWDVIFGNLTAGLGTTTDSYNAALAQAATYLGSIGESTAETGDLSRLWSFLIAQANASFPAATLTAAVDASLPTPGSLPFGIDRSFGSSIASRYQPGIFGLGWSTSWQTSLSTDSSGNVTISSGGSLAFFVLQANGSYLDTDGEFGTLTSSGGVYTFTATTGTQFVFLANGSLNYVQDTNGNRITLGYNASNQLVTLTYSNPGDASEPSETLTLSYNAQGLVQEIDDGTGAKWTYLYDASSHLLSVTAPGNLTTSYTYNTGTDPETANALLSITGPDGSQENFTYDPATGRLTGTSANVGAQAVTYAYLGQGEVSATDSVGHQSVVWFNELGAAARVEDPNGAVSSALFDNNGNLVNFTNAAGASYQYQYSQNGDLTQIVNPLGQVDKMSYGPLDRLTSSSDASGNTTKSSYSSSGNLMSITYPDGTSKTFTYDPLGNLADTVLQNGDAIDYQYTAQGLISKQTFADKTSQTFDYDAHGNLLTAKTFDASGTLTATTALTYNTANQLLSIGYPSGLSLTFTYNTLGQRVKSVDQSGYTVQYSYDAQGRLEKLQDGSGNLIVQYTYNDLGQLQSKQNGNGTSTSYTYDPAGNLLTITNLAADGKTVNSSFTYTYNLLGEVTSMVSAAGKTTYAYDATGQLTNVGLPNGTSISYVYNAAGDRTQVVTGGTATAYTSNSDNEITQVGSATYSYDKNGNLHTVSDSSGTTTYDYNDLNQLVSITAPDGTQTTFQYSPLGFMVGTSTRPPAGGASQTNYLVEPTGLGNVAASYDGSGSLIAHYNYGLGLVSQTGPGGTGYYDFDGSGNTVGITGSTGSYVNQYSYLPFGETTTVSATMPNLFTFVGQDGVIQIGSSLFYMRAREYTPPTGQFLSNDPIGLAGGDINIRAYASANPLSNVDPLGLQIGPAQLNQLGKDVGNVAQDAAAGFSAEGTALIDPVLEGAALDANLAYDTTIGAAVIALQLEFGNHLNGKGPVTQEQYEQALLAHASQVAKASKKAVDASKFGGKATNLGKDVQKLVKDATTTIRKALDPNALVGPAGYGTQGFIQPGGSWSYTVDFENDGSAAAQVVTVTEQLDPNLDWSTFQFGSFGFGSVKIAIPAGLKQYQKTVAYQNVDGSSLDVEVALDFNVQTGLLTDTFTSLDPATGQAPNGVSDGFLPPDNSAHIGEGFVTYTTNPKSGLTTGATLNAAASVVFDINAPLNTKTVTNTIDTGAELSSSVAALPATETSTSFTVSWSGTDTGGSGIAGYSVFVSDNGGAFTAFQTNTTATSATFAGVSGHTYAFYSMATDNVGNVQPTPTAAQATTKVMVAAVLPTSSVAALPATESSTSFTVSWSGTDVGGPGIASYDVLVSDNGGPFTAFQTKTTATSATFTGQAGHSYGFYSVATDTAGNAQPTPTAAQATTTVQATPFLITDHTYVIGSSSVTASAANGLLSGDTGPTQLSATAGTLTGAQGGTFTINADGSFSYTPAANFPGYDSTQVTVTDTSGDKGTETVTVVSQHAGVVWKFYESVLNRTPDPGGLQYWTNYFNGGGSTGDMAFGFFESDELLNKVLANYYEQYLLRPLDADGLAYWKGVWHATGGPEQIKAGFADSPEFYKSSGGTPDSWIDALYQRILSRTPDPQGKQFWLNYYQQQVAAGVDSGTVRYQIALGFFDSAESYGQDIAGWFQEYLFRVPTDAEKAQYVSQMEGGASDRTIEQAITNLPEYANTPPAPAAGTAAALPDFYQSVAASAKSQAAVAAKDLLFSQL